MKKIKAKIYAQLLNQIAQEKDKQKLDALIKSFVLLLAQNNQLSRLEEIINKFNQLFNKAGKIVDVNVSAPQMLDITIEKEILEWAKDICQADEANLKFTENKDLIGGAKIQAEDYLLDLSVKNTLNSIRNSIINL